MFQAPPAGLPGLFLRVYLPFAAAYFLSYLYRTVNAVVGPLIVSDLQLSAADLGLLTSAYFVMFSAVQLPLGIALDWFGPRRVQASLLLIAALGATLFGFGTSMTELVIGRTLIGLGVAAGLMGSLKIITLWFPQHQWALVNGLLMAAGGLGSLMATAPSQAALTTMTWHGLFFWLSGITVAVAFIVWLIVPEKPALAATGTLKEQIQAVGRIMRDGYFWCVMPAFTFQQASMIGMQTLWIGPWLRDVAGQDAATRAQTMLITALAMTAGFLTSGMASSALRRAGISSTTTVSASLVLFVLCSAALMLESLGIGTLVAHVVWWSGFAFLGTWSILYFPILTAAFPVELSGRVTTSGNFIMFSAVFLTQWGIGRMLDFWPRTASGGYAATGYAISFAVLITLQILAMIWQARSRARPMSEAVGA